MNFTLSGLKIILNKVFDIRSGETKRVLLLQINIFLLITVILILKPIVNALFLDRFGVERLPQVFVLVAVFAAILSAFYSKALLRLSLHKIIRNTNIIAFVSLLFFGLFLTFDWLNGWILYLFYICVALFAVLSASQFWILVNVVLNVREAKRLFGFIGAGAIGGGIFGGYLTSIAAPLIGSENLIFLCAAILLACIPITQTLWKKHVEPNQSSIRQTKRSKSNAEYPLQIIRRSKHLTLIAGILGISVVVSKLVDYQFSALASSTYTNPDELASFFGFWFSTMNILSLFIQLFLTKKVVGKYGVGFSLFVLPIGILMPALLLIFVPQLWVAVLMRINEGSLKQSVNKAGVELLALPIPLEVKNQTKTFIDVFVDSLATGIGGLILILFVSILEIPLKLISIVVLVLVGIWIYMALLVRKEYIKSFQLKVAKPKDKKTVENIDFSNNSVIGGLQKVLQSGREKDILYILKKLKETSISDFVESLKSLLKHSNPLIRAEALSCLYFYKDDEVFAMAKDLIQDPDDEVTVAAFEYLIEHSPNEMESLMNQFLEDEDYEVRGAALVSLAKEIRDNPKLKDQFNLKEKILSRINQLHDLSDPAHQLSDIMHLMQAIGYAGEKELYPLLEEYMNHKQESIAITAIQAAGYTLSKNLVAPLVYQLSEKNLQKHALKSLANYGPGLIDVLVEKIKKHNINDWRNISLVLASLHSQQSIDLLFELVKKGDIATRSLALKSLNNMKISAPHLNFYKSAIIDLILNEAKNYVDILTVLYIQNIKKNTLDNDEASIADARHSLIDLLERRLDGNLERIFYLLGLKYSPEDILSIYEGIQSKKPDLYINAIEFLDNILDPNLKKILMPLVETAILDNISKDTMDNLNIKVAEQLECFELILNGNDLRLKLAVLYLIRVLKSAKYNKLAKRFINDQNPKVKTFALEAVKLFEDEKGL
ncbi:MAG: Npt1/Npt2 family nucleotide transporter [Cyclobacteriaceae bacterium]